MKFVSLFFAMTLSYWAHAGTCTLLVGQDEIGSGKTFSSADMAGLAAKGYDVTSDTSAIFDGALTLITGSDCITYLGFYKSCEYEIQLGHAVGNGVSFDNPVSGTSFSKALSNLPNCR